MNEIKMKLKKWYSGFQAYVKEYYPETTGYRIEVHEKDPDNAKRVKFVWHLTVS